MPVSSVAVPDNVLDAADGWKVKGGLDHLWPVDWTGSEDAWTVARSPGPVPNGKNVV